MSRSLSAYKTCNSGASQVRTRDKFLWLPVRGSGGRLHWLVRREVQEKIVIVSSWAPGMSNSAPVAKWVITDVAA